MLIGLPHVTSVMRSPYTPNPTPRPNAKRGTVLLPNSQHLTWQATFDVAANVWRGSQHLTWQVTSVTRVLHHDPIPNGTDRHRVGTLWEGYDESRRCSRDTYPESYITKYTSIRR